MLMLEGDRGKIKQVLLNPAQQRDQVQQRAGRYLRYGDAARRTGRARGVRGSIEVRDTGRAASPRES